MKPTGAEYISFNRSDVIFGYFFSEDCRRSKMVLEHFLVYVYSGRYIFEEGGEITTVNPVEFVFLRRDNRASMTKLTLDGEPFMGIFMTFRRGFLRGLYRTINRKAMPADIGKHRQSVVKLSNTPDIKGLFLFMTPYFGSEIKPSDEMMRLKMLEGVQSFPNMDGRFFPTAFDFTESWKIDIFDFLNGNYMYDVWGEETGSFTGRRLSTFKRVFRKSALSPCRPGCLYPV